LLLQQSSVIMPKRLKLSADVCQKNVVQSQFDTQEGRRSIRIADAARPKSPLLRLPKEVRTMIFEHLFTMMTEGKTVRFDSFFWHPSLPRGEYRGTILMAERTRLFMLSVFLICKQLSEEAQEVFWTTNTFSCHLMSHVGASLLDVCTARQTYLNCRPPKHVPTLFPVHRIRRLDILILSNYCNKAYVLEGLWELARIGHPKLQVTFYHRNVDSQNDLDPIHTPDSELANWHKIKAYQILRKGAGVSMNFTSSEFWAMCHLGHWFSFNLPAIPDQNVKKEDENVSQQSGSQ
ncbi:hypothetical protein KCU67_g3144, partial [Aureobasidium melanogenum]